MKRVVRFAVPFAAAIALLVLGAGAAQAQEWPTSLSLRCNWTKPNASGALLGGTSRVMFKNFTGDDFQRTGWLVTTYPDGSVIERQATLYWDWWSGGNRFVYEQPSPYVECTVVKTYEGGTVVTWEGCTNGTVQFCRL